MNNIINIDEIYSNLNSAKSMLINKNITEETMILFNTINIIKQKLTDIIYDINYLFTKRDDLLDQQSLTILTHTKIPANTQQSLAIPANTQQSLSTIKKEIIYTFSNNISSSFQINNNNNCIYYDTNKKSLFVNFIHNNKIEVCLQNINLDKKKTIDCKYKTKDHCKNQNCLFVHVGETYNRVPFYNKTSKHQTFGSTNSLNEDLLRINYEDIKKIIFNNFSSILLIYLWFDYNCIQNQIINHSDYSIRSQ